MEPKILTASELNQLNQKDGNDWTEEEKANFLATVKNFKGVSDLDSLGVYNEIRDFLDFVDDGD